MKIDFSPYGWGRVIAATVGGIVLCVSAALFVDSFNFATLTPEEFQRAILVDTLLPTFLAGPLMFLLMWKVRALSLAHRELSIIASTDSLTAVLNRGAFTMLVEAYLAQTREKSWTPHGALLVIDADHFKRINDQFGHEEGDQALRLIARTIKENLRSPDIVGRIGGEEFSVFLAEATPQTAIAIADRIRLGISSSSFSPKGRPWGLSVSIGGVTFSRRTSYDELFSLADQRLYGAKSSGRNQIDLGRLPEAIMAA